MYFLLVRKTLIRAVSNLNHSSTGVGKINSRYFSWYRRITTMQGTPRANSFNGHDNKKCNKQLVNNYGKNNLCYFVII